ncbi:DUF4347 domain-containing protein, partial [Janthinobacterium sp. UMAB-60]|uniref:DUF4347 domain-containing protein n=1 Tax=Janthinobacterium sp. UMAB-60 TaxID=1365365 RepID=UPI0027D8C439
MKDEKMSKFVVSTFPATPMWWRLFLMACICANLLFPAPAWSSGAPPIAATSSQPRKQILFVEDNVADYRELIGSGPDHMDVVVLDGEHDGLRQIAQALETRRDIAGLHLISHGGPGSLQLGSLQLGRQQLKERSADLGIIRAALRRDADILLYGCNVAEGKAGRDFIGALAGRTGARVAASNNLTGAAAHGGDWLLEARTAPLRSTALAFPAYRHVLPSVAGTMTIPYSQPDFSFSSPSIVDGQVGTGSTNIPNVVYEFYFANTANTRFGEVSNVDLTSSTGSMFLFYNPNTTGFDEVGSLIVKAQSNRTFGISSFRIQDAQDNSSTYTLTGYRNGALAVPGWTFTTGGNYDQVQISPPPQFTNVDELRITSNGGTSGMGSKLFREGFNSFVFTEPTANAALSGLSATAGALSPAFATATTAYTIAVPNATASTTITPTVDTPGTTVTVNGVSVASGAASGSIALNVGANTITTIVTALDGSTTKTYTVTVTRAASSNADLSALSLSSGTLSPAFAAGTTSYTASVPFATTSMTFTPTVSDATASVTVNGVATTSGNASGA